MRGKRSFSRRAWGAVCVLLVLAGAGAIRWYWQSPRPNIILVTFDTTRADHLGAYGYKHGLTEAFDALAGEGVLFEQAFAPAPITLPSHTTMLTGLYPPEHDLRVNGAGQLSSEIPFLPEILKSNGYDTAAFIAAAPVLGAQFGLNRGFDTYNDAPAKPSGRTRPYGGARRDGEEVVDLALGWLKQRTSRPFFCWIHLYDAHGPYDTYSDIYQDEFQDHPYDAGIAWEVRQFGRVKEFLKKRQLESNTLVVVAGDHGEGLGDHGEQEHGMLIYNSTMHVPLVFAGPGFCKPGTRVPNSVSLVDLMPTLLDALQIPLPKHLSGRSLLPALQGGAIQSQDCYAESEMPYHLNRWCPLQTIVSDNWKYIQSTRPELYNLAIDPGELNNLVEAEIEQAQRLQASLAAIRDSFARTQAAEVNLSEQDVANLRSLGYVAGGTSFQDQDALSSDENLTDVKDMMPFVSKFEDAKALAAHGKLEEAIGMLQEVSVATDNYPLSDMRLGELLAQVGRNEEAEAFFRSVLARRPDYVQAHFTLARLLASQGLFEQVEAHFREYVKMLPNDASGHFELANVLTQRQQVDEAIREYREALAISPHMVGANVALGRLLFMLQRPNEAAPYLEQAIEDDPRNIVAHENLMLALAQTGQAGRAMKVGEQALALNPNSFETRYNLGLILIQNQRIPDGIQQLREAQKLRPDDPRPTQQIQNIQALLNKTGN